MLDRVTVVAMVFAATALPAFAGPANGIPGRLPEPASMTLFGLGIGGAYIAKKFIGRK